MRGLIPDISSDFSVLDARSSFLLFHIFTAQLFPHPDRATPDDHRY
jgi:hypothetical protein